MSYSSQTGDLTASNVQNRYVAEVWRTTGDQDQYLEFDFTTAQAIDTIDIVNHNLTSAADVILSMGSTTNPTDFTTVMAWREFDMFEIFAQQSYRYARVRFADTNNPDGYIEVGQVWLGSYGETAILFSPEWADGDTFIDRRQVSDGGLFHGELISRRKELPLLFAGLTTAEADAIQGIVEESSGSQYPVFVWPKRTEPEAYIVHIVEYTKRRTQQMIEISLRLMEQIRGVLTGS